MRRVQQNRGVSANSARSCFALKRTWSLLFVVFAVLWLSVLRYGIKSLNRRSVSSSVGGTSSGKSGSSAAAASSDPCKSPKKSRAVAFRCFLDDARGGASTSASNDMGFCLSGAATGEAAKVRGDLDFKAPLVCKAGDAAANAGVFGLFSSARRASMPVCTSQKVLADLVVEAGSPLCREIAPKALKTLRSLVSGGKGGQKLGSKKSKAAEAAADANGGAPIWSSAACGFLARELAAAREPSAAVLLEDADVPQYTIRACGVTIGPADVSEHCGLEPEFDKVSNERLLNPFSRDAPQTFFMWNKALAAATDASPHHMVDGTYNFNATPYEIALPGATTFYVVASVLASFIDHIVPKLTKPFVVVSGSSDDGSPLQNTDPDSEARHLRRMKGFLENPLCVALFVQNPNYKHRKVVPNHIGLDFHTIARPELESHSWGPPMSVLRQDAELMKLRCMLPPFSKRPPIALMNFKEAGRGIRSMVAGLLGNRESVKYVGNLDRSQLWARYGEFAFVISPRGYGLDCHRTWEALALGNAVIASVDDFLHELYEDLPVIQVSNWDIVNKENLERWHSELSTRWNTFRFEKLRNEYWTAAVLRARNQASLETIYEYSTNAFNFSEGRLVWGRGQSSDVTLD